VNITLQKRRLHGLTFKNENFTGLDLSSSVAFGSVWTGCEFSECELVLSDFQTAKFTDCAFTKCNVSASVFRSTQMRRVKFIDCDLRHSSFAVATPMIDVSFWDCQMQYSIFIDATARSVLFMHSNLHGADLRFIEANHVDFRGSNLWNAHVQIGCPFFNGVFDARQADLFTGMVARVHPNEERATILRDQAGKQYDVVSRLMDDREGGTAAEESA
jgi:uncharacterized protein YjbI with pentapeptide repeats